MTETLLPLDLPDHDALTETLLQLPPTLRIISLNCWGLKFLSKHRNARLEEIGHQLAIASPPPSIVGLQECWTQQDYLSIRESTKNILPYGKFYWSGIFGGGLAILSKWPIEESWMYRYPLNGRPSAFFRGDWYVGKGVACARIRIGPGVKDVLEVFNTHLHAPYERDPDDSYICHRTAQAWEIARLMRHAAERGHVVVGLGDFNMVPLSLAHRVVEAHAPVKDIWRVVKPESALGSADQAEEKARGRRVPTVEEAIEEDGSTCDGMLNTWRWSKQMRKELERGRDSEVELKAKDPRARRLDYIFLGNNAAVSGSSWTIDSVQVGMTMRHSTLRCSLSDHFSVETTLRRVPNQKSIHSPKPVSPLSVEAYDQILEMISKYDVRERSQRRQRLGRFGLSIFVSLASFVAIWWSPRNFVAFILVLLSTLGFGGGVLEGLMGGLFVGSELRALREFEYEIRLAREQAVVQEQRNDMDQIGSP